MFTQVKDNELNLIINVREECKEQDLLLVKEVIKDDEYGIKKYFYPVFKDLQVKTVVDCGGHIGCFGMLIKQFYPLAKVIAIEPNQDSANLYRLNMSSNNIDNVKVLNLGLSYDNNKSVSIMVDGSTAISLLVTPQEAEKAIKGDFFGSWDLIDYFSNKFGKKRNFIINSREIRTITFEEILKNENIDEIDILKLDCEGAESDMFIHCAKESLNKVKIILCEYHFVPGPSILYHTHMKDKFENFEIRDRDFTDAKWGGGISLFGSIGYFMAIRKDIFEQFKSNIKG